MSMSAFEDEPASEEELAAARAFAEQVDEAIAGAAPRSQAGTNESELGDLSMMIHAAHHAPPLAEAKQQSLIDEALSLGAGVGDCESDFAARDKGDELARARAKRKPRWQVAAAILAVAAAIAFWMTKRNANTDVGVPLTRTQARLEVSEKSRPSDALIGPIERSVSAQAMDRIDRIYQDRMGGYRSLRFRNIASRK